jgi:hypothetical protein
MRGAERFAALFTRTGSSIAVAAADPTNVRAASRQRRRLNATTARKHAPITAIDAAT